MQTFSQYVEACHYSTPSCSYSFIKCWLCAFKGQKKTPLPLFLLVSCHHVRQKSFFLVLSGSGKMTFAAQSGAYNLQHHRPSSGRRLTVPNVTRRVLPISTDDLDGLQQVNPPPPHANHLQASKTECNDRSENQKSITLLLPSTQLHPLLF